LTLHAAGRKDSPYAERGLRHLIETQAEDGSWPEDLATGTGFPNVFYMRYTMYRHYFPLWVLGLYAQ
jgi:squalene-hopene/tetraprenyl-beta-curcumene cyclase